jgi:hypothetical protein
VEPAAFPAPGWCSPSPIRAPDAGPLAGLAGRHRGTVATGMRMSVPRPALLGSASPHTAAALAGEVPLPAYRPDVIGTRLA